ncbi:MAG: hypothetical protein IT483_04105 [Gammaproteobacteria bacterium]|jgi:hypothetical protein|nr:hypothetical protein [Gammaproteobacteria bacterium]
MARRLQRPVGVLPRTLKARSRPADTALQRHASFFDDDGDRGVGLGECTRGLRALGMPAGLAEAAALTIVAALSLQTRGSLLAMNIDVDKVQKGIHEGDTGILNNKGRFDARRFGKIFGRWARLDVDGGKALTSVDLARMIAANREGLAGYVTAMAEWQLLLALAADTRAVEAGRTVPAVSVARIRAFYEGTLFYDLARERA